MCRIPTKVTSATDPDADTEPDVLYATAMLIDEIHEHSYSAGRLWIG
jgi:hypothetical protein